MLMQINIHILVVNGYRRSDLFIMAWRSVNMKRFHLLIINGVVRIDQICSFCCEERRETTQKKACESHILAGWTTSANWAQIESFGSARA